MSTPPSCTPIVPKLSLSYRLLCLAIMGVIFYSTYGLANYLASIRTSVPEVYWPWETHIPFWDWSIVPYWTLNLFYAAAFLLCQNRAQIHRLLQQLILAQLIAVACFVLFPLSFTWAKPATDGLTGRLFTALAGFDQPYNQAPSLHIILTVIIGRFYWYRLPNLWRPVWLIWLVLIGVSVLTTYQHHFIDLPTGVLVGCWVLWLRPWQGNEPIAKTVFAHPNHPHLTLIAPKLHSPAHRKWTILYASLAALLTGASLLLQGAYYWLFWPAIICACLAWMYGKTQPSWWQKQAHGRHSLPVAIMALPARLCIRLNMAYWLRRHDLSNQVLPKVHLGSVLATPQYQAVLDVCAEYPAPHTPPHYITIPMLDMVPVAHETLRLAADALHELLQQDQPVLVCCALGYSRSCAVVLTYLLRFGHAQDLQAALILLQTARPNIVLYPSMQAEILKAAHD